MPSNQVPFLAKACSICTALRTNGIAKKRGARARDTPFALRWEQHLKAPRARTLKTMTDPVSLAASIITLLGTVNFTIQTIRGIHNAPAQVREITEELQRISLVVNELSQLQDETTLAHLTGHLEITRMVVMQLRCTIEECTSGGFWMRCANSIPWMSARRKLARLATELCKWESRLTTDMQLLTL